MGVYGKLFGWSRPQLRAGRGAMPMRKNGHSWVLNPQLRVEGESEAKELIEMAMLAGEMDADADNVAMMAEESDLIGLDTSSKHSKETASTTSKDSDESDISANLLAMFDPGSVHDFGDSPYGKLRYAAHALSHHPAWETLTILLILLEISMVMIELGLGATFELPSFTKDYKSLKLSYDASVNASTCTVAGVFPGAPTRRMLSASVEAKAECQVVQAYKMHHFAEVVSLVALSIMLVGVTAEVLAEGFKDFFCPNHMDWIHGAHLMDFFVITTSWVIDVFLKKMISGAASASSILVILRLWRVIRVLSGMGTFIAKQKKAEFQILRIKRKVHHAYLYLDKKGKLEDYFASDGEISADEIQEMREIRESQQNMLADIEKQREQQQQQGQSAKVRPV